MFQAVGFGVMGLALVVMAVGLLNESEQGTEYIAQARFLRGEALLRDQANKLDAARAAKKKGQGLNAVDSMVSSWSTDSDKEDEKKELKSFDKGLVLSPKQMGMTTYDKNGNPELALVQQDWTPSGQTGLNHELKQAHQQADAQQRKNDGLKGDSVLSSAGLEDDTPKKDDDDLDLGLMQLIQEPEDDWQPRGQPGLDADISKAHNRADKEQLKIDGLKGTDVLSSTGMESAGTDDKDDQDSTDIGDIFGHDNEQLVQEWKPSGQKLNGTPEEAVANEEKDDGDLVRVSGGDNTETKKTVAQTDILGAVGLDSLKDTDDEDEVEKLGVVNTDDIQLLQVTDGGVVKKIVKAVKKIKAGAKKTVSKKVAKEAKKLTKKVAGFSKSTTTKKSTKAPPKRLLKNVLFLKVYATLVADEVVDNSRHLGALGTLLKAMAVTSKLNPVQQYVGAMKSLSKAATRGLPKYTLRHVAKAMSGKGLVVMAPVASRPGVFVRLDGRDLGLKESYPLLGKLAIRVATFVTAMAKMKKKITIDLKSRNAQHFTLQDFNRIFKPTCTGTGKAFNKCAKMGKGKCAAAKSCKWIPAWDGSVAPATMTMVLDTLNA